MARNADVSEDLDAATIEFVFDNAIEEITRIVFLENDLVEPDPSTILSSLRTPPAGTAALVAFWCTPTAFRHLFAPFSVTAVMNAGFAILRLSDSEFAIQLLLLDTPERKSGSNIRIPRGCRFLTGTFLEQRSHADREGEYISREMLQRS